MTYTLINLVFLMPTLVLAVVGWRSGRVSRSALALTAIVMIALTIVFDNLMIRVGLFTYAEDLISGIMIGAMPVEDLAYTVFAVLALPALWELLGRRRTSAVRSDAVGSGAVRVDTARADEARVDEARVDEARADKAPSDSAQHDPARHNPTQQISAQQNSTQYDPQSDRGDDQRAP
ncbi:lycopene cyclase domain-containing protein [Brevibacterium pityocampae]